MLDSQKYNNKKAKQNHKIYKKYTYEIYFKNGVFFLQGNSRL